MKNSCAICDEDEWIDDIDYQPLQECKYCGAKFEFDPDEADHLDDCPANPLGYNHPDFLENIGAIETYEKESSWIKKFLEKIINPFSFAFTGWLDLLDSKNYSNYNFWHSCLLPRFLDGYRYHGKALTYSEYYPMIPAWYHEWIFVEGKWELDELNSIPF